MANTEHILIVEDGLLVRNQLRVRLKSEGYQVTVSGTVSEALHAIRAKTPDLIILDLMLPEDDPFAALTDGFAFLRLMRSTLDAAGTAVIIYSVNCTAEVEAQAKSMGVSRVVPKKDGLPALLTSIRLALDDRASRTPQQPTPAPASVPEAGAAI